MGLAATFTPRHPTLAQAIVTPYVIVENATGNIKAIDPAADLSNAGTYPSVYLRFTVCPIPMQLRLHCLVLWAEVSPHCKMRCYSARQAPAVT